MDNGELLRLYGTSLSVADDYSKEYVSGYEFIQNGKTQQEFKRLRDLTVTKVEEFHQSKYDIADSDGVFADNFKGRGGWSLYTGSSGWLLQLAEMLSADNGSKTP